MDVIKYISVDVLRLKRQALIDKRNDLLMNQNYVEAEKLLPKIHKLNDEFNKMLKKNLDVN